MKASLESISQRFWDFLTTADPWKIFLLVFGSAFLLRMPTLLIDYIHIDVITSYIIAQRDIAGLFFTPNKEILYHLLVKWSIMLFGDSPISFHFIGILFVLLTMIFIYLLGNRIYSQRAGMFAALFYGCIISSFQTEYLATNAEVIYNLFFISAFYFFYVINFERRVYFIIPLIISLAMGALIKFQGIFAIFALLFYLFAVKPAFIIRGKKLITYYTILALLAVAALVFIYIDWNYTQILLSGSLRKMFKPMVDYVANRGFSPFHIIGKLIWRAYQFTLFHSIVWIPGIIAIVSFLRRNRAGEERNEKEAYLIGIALFLFLTIFFGGARLSPHYFIPVLPPLTILAAQEVLRRLDRTEFKKRAFIMLAFPVLFFFIWNMKDAYIGNCKPSWKHEESRCTFFFRILVIGSHGEYLLPHKSLLPVLTYLREQTSPEETIFVWPMGSEVVYYSKRRSATHQFWFNEKALHAIVQNEKGNRAEFIRVEDSFIRRIRKCNPDYFIDVGSTAMIRKVLVYRKKDDPPFYFDINTAPMIRFGSFGGLDNFPKLIRFLNEQFQYVGSFGTARVWKRRETDQKR